MANGTSVDQLILGNTTTTLKKERMNVSVRWCCVLPKLRQTKIRVYRNAMDSFGQERPNLYLPCACNSCKEHTECRILRHRIGCSSSTTIRPGPARNSEAAVTQSLECYRERTLPWSSRHNCVGWEVILRDAAFR